MFNKVCIIDDDELFVVIAKLQMEEIKFSQNIIDFSDGREAIEFFQNSPKSELPELIFLDINMNFMDGWEFLEALKPLNILDNLAIYISSSSINPADIERAKVHPYVNKFISKPLSYDKLSEILNENKSIH